MFDIGLKQDPQGRFIVTSGLLDDLYDAGNVAGDKMMDKLKAVKDEKLRAELEACIIDYVKKQGEYAFLSGIMKTDCYTTIRPGEMEG